MVSTVWSDSCLLFFYSRCRPRAQPFVKVGARARVSHGVGATLPAKNVKFTYTHVCHTEIAKEQKRERNEPLCLLFDAREANEVCHVIIIIIIII